MLDLRATTTQGQETVLAETAVEGFKTSLRGKLIMRGDEDYDEARTVFNAHDRQVSRLDHPLCGSSRRY
jgi:hypothetical protein